MKKIFLIILTVAFIGANAQSKKILQPNQGVEKAPGFKKELKNNKPLSRKEILSLKKEHDTKKLNVADKSISSMWNVQFQHNIEIGSGIETNGYYYYVSQWNTDTIYTYNINGTLFGKYKFPITGIRDMAFDGTYFYGSNASNKIYKMDFTNYLVVDSIVCPSYVSVRHIAYDNVSNAFWVGDWDTDIYKVNFSGQVLSTINATDHNLYGMYGSAFDNTTPGGPYLWVADQGGWSGNDIVMIKIATGKQTGVIHNCLDDVASDLMDPIVGGLFIKSNLISGTSTLGGIIQRQRIFGYELSSLVATNDVGVEDVLSPILSSGCSLSSSESITVRVRNYGLNSASNVSLNLNLNNTNYVAYLPATLNSFEFVDVTFNGTFNFSQPLVYKMKFSTSYSIDGNPANDVGYYNIITGNGLITVDILTDDYPGETYWEVYNNYTYDVYGSSYAMDAVTFYSTDICADTNLCYGFTITDDYGDGMLSPAYYEVFYNNVSVAYDTSFTTLFEEIPYMGHCDYADVGVTGVLSPVSSCGLSDQEFVTVVVKNFGTQTVANADIAYTVNGNTFIETLPFSLDSQQEETYTFVNVCDLSNIAMHELKVFTLLSSDMNKLNDSTTYEVENYYPTSMPYNVDFDNPTVNAQLLVEDQNQDYFTWSLYDAGGVNNTDCAIYTFNPNEPANDWLFTKCIELLAGNQYVLNFYYKAQSATYPEKLKVHIAQAPSSMATITQPLVNLSNITDTTFTLASASFNVDDLGSGNYYIGFNAYSDMTGWNLYIDNISVTGPAFVDDMGAVQKQYSVYPNPANNKLSVELVSGFSNKLSEQTISILNLQGQLLMKESFNALKKDIDVHDLNKGMYIIKIESEEGLWIKKFVKN